MFECSFELNNQPMSTFKAGPIAVSAFSGQGLHRNKRSSGCLRRFGPIPAGEYYIFDRASGGHLAWLKDLFSDRNEWFALYAADGKLDDEILCEDVKRGRFRLHPKGQRGLSEGCITIENLSDFHRIRAILKGTTLSTIPGSNIKTYGKVIVK